MMNVAELLLLLYVVTALWMNEPRHDHLDFHFSYWASSLEGEGEGEWGPGSSAHACSLLLGWGVASPFAFALRPLPMT